MSVKEYTKEFYKLNIRVGHIEENPEKVARYLNGLRYEIQDEIEFYLLTLLKKHIQFSLKEEEKLARKKNQRSRGHSSTRGRGKQGGRGRSSAPKEEANNSHQQEQSPRGGDFRGRRPYQRGRGSSIRCFRCNKFGHRSYECPENASTSRGSANVVQAEEESVESSVHENVPEVGESLMMKRILLKRKTLFRTVCKRKGKCCKVIIDSGSTDNLVSTEMVEKLALKKTTHHVPYKVSWLQKGHQLIVNE
jgi:hypothetical protein